MSIQIGGIDLAQGVIDTQFRLGVLEKIVEHLLNRAAPGSLTEADLERFRAITVQELQRKYPQAGIAFTKTTK